MFAEEVLLVVNRTILGTGDVVEIEGGDIEHLAGTLRIGSSDQRGVEVEEPSIVEVFMDGESHGVAQAQHTAEIVGAGTQMGDFAEELHRVTLLLQGILLGVGGAVNLDGVGLDLHGLTLSL